MTTGESMLYLWTLLSKWHGIDDVDVFETYVPLSALESCVRGRTQSLAASQTQLSAQSVVELVTSLQTASLPGNPIHSQSAFNIVI